MKTESTVSSEEGLERGLRDICSNLPPAFSPVELGLEKLHAKALDVQEVYDDFLQWFSGAKWSPPQHDSLKDRYADLLAVAYTKDYTVNGRFMGVDLVDEVPVVSMVLCAALRRRFEEVNSDLPNWPRFLFSDAIAKVVTRDCLLFEKNDQNKRPGFLMVDILNTSPKGAARGVLPLLKEVQTMPLPKKFIVRVGPPPAGSPLDADFSIHWLMSNEVEVDRDELV